MLRWKLRLISSLTCTFWSGFLFLSPIWAHAEQTIISQYLDTPQPYTSWRNATFSINDPRYLVATGTASAISFPVSPLKVLSASDTFQIYFLKPFNGQFLDCKTPVKTLVEWGISLTPKDPYAQMVTFPLSGTQCDVTNSSVPGSPDAIITVPFRNGAQDGIIGSMGTASTSQKNFIVYGQEHTPSDPCKSTNTCPSNVLFLPGIESSRLYRANDGVEKKVWEPHLHDTLADLYMTSDGTSVQDDVYAKTGDVLDEISATGGNVYESFINKMDELESEQVIKDWEAVPYDWRLSLEDILTKGNQTESAISYLQATSTPYIIQELKRLAATSRSGKVTVIAHSNGGLVAKKITEVLGADAAKLIDKLIFVAVPQAGTPMALAALMHGYDQGYGVWPITFVSEANARTFASTTPMTYNLLPSDGYFTQVDDPVISFDPSLADWITRYGTLIHSEERLHSFITDTFGRVNSQTGDTDEPIQGAETLLSDAETLHTDLDSWTPPAGVKLIQIAGWGIPTTVQGIRYKKKDAGIKPEPEFTIDGDGTVVVPSALWTSTLSAPINYWLDLKSYNKSKVLSTLGGVLPFKHANILETDPILNFVSDQIRNSSSEDYKFLSGKEPEFVTSQLRYSLHSPLTLDLYDSEGNHTGVSDSTGQIEEEIPGTYFAQFGDTKYAFSDASIPLRIKLDGYGSGIFTLNIDEYTGEVLTASTTFKDVPTTPNTSVSLGIESDLSTLSPMEIDENGDGIKDITLVPVPNGSVTVKTPLTVTADNKTIILGSPLPPFTASITGFKGNDTATSSDITGSPDCSVSLTDPTIGSYSINCTGGTLSSSTYDFNTFVPGILTVVYRWDGFLQPINDTAHQPEQGFSVFKAGSTVPVKFQLKSTDGTVIQATTPPTWITPQKGGAMTASVGESIYSDSGTTGTVYKWDNTTQQYVYNWSTKGLTPGYWYKIFAKLEDGKIYPIVIGLK